MTGRDIAITGAARTSIGSYLGSLAELTAPQLGEVAIRAAVARSGIDPGAVDEVVMGNVLQAGVGQAPARQAARRAGLSDATRALTLNKVCGSGLKAVAVAAQSIALGDSDVAVAGGMESMSNAPHYVRGLRTGIRMGNGDLLDGMVLDGLTDAYDGVHMGVCADVCAVRHGVSREEQDAFALESLRRALEAQSSGAFDAEIVPVQVPDRRAGTVEVSRDEGPGNAKPDKIPSLRPVFGKDGTVTAANASSLNDGAAAVVLMDAERAVREGRQVLGRITGTAEASRAPAEFTDAPTDAIQRLLERLGLTTADVDLWEINEAFAVVSIANNRLLGLDPARVNVRGGAVALGHPIGASGARILVTLLHAMRDLGADRGVASLCIGGGEAIAMMVERA